MSGQQYFVERRLREKEADELEEAAIFGTTEGKEKRKKNREDKVSKRRQWRIDKINALKEKFYAVASKRKWLVFLIGIAIVAYLLISKGIF